MMTSSFFSWSLICVHHLFLVWTVIVCRIRGVQSALMPIWIDLKWNELAVLCFGGISVSKLRFFPGSRKSLWRLLLYCSAIATHQHPTNQHHTVAIDIDVLSTVWKFHFWSFWCGFTHWEKPTLSVSLRLCYDGTCIYSNHSLFSHLICDAIQSILEYPPLFEIKLLFYR